MKKWLLTFFLFSVPLFSQLSLEVVWEKQQSGVIDAKFSPDGKFVYCAIGADIKKLDVETGEFIATFDNGELTGKNIYLEISHDGKTLITGNTTSPGGLYLWDTEQQKVIREIKIDGITKDQELYLSSFAPDNRHILLTLYTGYPYPKLPTNEILLFDLIDNKVIKKVPYERIEQLHYSKDGKYFITGTAYEDNCRVTLWDANELKPIKEFKDLGTNDNGFKKIQISDNNKLIGVRTDEYLVNIIECETGNIIKTNDIGTSGFNFELLMNDTYLIYQYGKINNGITTYKYPDIFQSNLDLLSGVIVTSKELLNESYYKLKLFHADALSIKMLTNSTTSVHDPIKPEINIIVEPEKITVNFDGAENIQIFDMLGNILLNKNISEPIISLPNTFSPGIYICVVKSNNKEYSQKFMVVR